MTAVSQNSITVFGGITNNYLQANYSNRPNTQVESKTGFNFGISFQYELCKSFEICTGIVAIQKNYTISRTGDYSGAYESFIRTYIQVPLYMRMTSEINKLELNLDLGSYGAWWINGRLKGNIPDIFSATSNGNGETIPLRQYSEKYEFSSEKDRQLEWGGMIATGASYRLTEKIAVFINLAYCHALTSDQKKYSINHIESYNRTISICAGTKFLLK